jgi:hypothetical protein
VGAIAASLSGTAATSVQRRLGLHRRRLLRQIDALNVFFSDDAAGFVVHIMRLFRADAPAALNQVMA